jgi:hypothetical protein
MRIGPGAYVAQAVRRGKHTCARCLAWRPDAPACTDADETQRDTEPRHADAGEGCRGTADDVEAPYVSESWTRVRNCKPHQG